MRSKLFVPGSRPELFSKALAGAADALSIDLEDAVAEGRKSEARALTAAFIDKATAAGCDKTLIVRVNALDTPHFEADVAAIVRPGLHMLNLPKAETVEQVLLAVRAVERAEQANGVTPGHTRLLLNIETPPGLQQAAALAGGHARVAGLQIGYGDLFEPLGIDRRDAAAVHAILLAVRLAAGTAGVFAYDGAFTNVQDTAGYQAEATQARRLGFLGKSCIHPSQVPLANAVFSPGDEEIAHARRVVEAARDAAARGVGAFMVDGRMVDGPFIAGAEAIVANARRWGRV